MARWYMPLFRQYLEWSIVNTGVILRQRRDGKKIWSAINLKLKLAEQLSFLGKEEEPSISELSEELSEDDGSDTNLDRHLNAIRLQRNILHTPGFIKRRLACRVHRQRKDTQLQCMTCKKPLCSSYCWKRYHSKVKYLYDDPGCRGKVIHNRNCD